MADNDQVYLDRRAQVLEQITVHPETHYQDSFESVDECGTTRCVAGWAIVFASKAEGSAYLDEDRRAVAADLGMDRHSTNLDVAQRLLGLDYSEAYELFYRAESEELAVLLLRQYAAGLDHIVHLEGYESE